MIDLVFRGIGLASILLMGLAIWQMIRLIGREQRMNLSSAMIGLVLSPVMLAVNLVFLGRIYSEWLAPLLLVLGLGFGLAWGQTNRIYVKENSLVGRRSILHLIFWGLSYSITQVLALFAPAAVVAGGLAAMFFSAGSSVGTNLNLLLRELWLRRALKGERRPSPAASNVVPATPPRQLPERPWLTQSSPAPRYPPDLPERERYV